MKREVQPLGQIQVWSAHFAQVYQTNRITTDSCATARLEHSTEYRVSPSRRWVSKNKYWSPTYPLAPAAATPSPAAVAYTQEQHWHSVATTHRRSRHLQTLAPRRPDRAGVKRGRCV
ncbi:hypothetical protein PpBr36_05430 [Pyricularia pennisetigena]|uniref:hypothetical protein n=1 Tax=Pyricularia pennisetigena TaxID=1578925 RepID=UPI00114D88D1|nr:hypothetical protein PpBr36_05430 [Pyricularia pennisetigena]TLS26700.1 hypothetical protein PpBr36_05430 [Pyricularia pennisetigena]